MTAIFFMLLRDQMYNPNIGKGAAPKRGKIELQKLIEYYQLKGYTVVNGKEAV